MIQTNKLLNHDKKWINKKSVLGTWEIKLNYFGSSVFRNSHDLMFV